MKTKLNKPTRKKFNLNAIKNAGDYIATGTNWKHGVYSCLAIKWNSDWETKDIYSDLFGFDTGVVETLITQEDKENYKDEDYFNLRLMLVAMFHEVARRENRGEKIL